MGEFDFGDLGQGLDSLGTFGAPNIPQLSGLDLGSLPGLPSTMPNTSFPSISPSISTDMFAGGGRETAYLPNPRTDPSVQFPNAGPQQPQGGGILGSILGQGTQGGGILKDITGLAGVGLQGLGIKNQIDALHQAKKQSGQMNAMQEVQKKSAQPLQEFGTQQLQQSAAGNVSPAVQAMIDQWVQAQKAAMAQKMASMGITNSTMAQSAMAQIDQQALAMKANMINMDEKAAIAALSQAMQGAQGGAYTAGMEQQALDNLIAQANKAMASLTAAG